MTAVKLLARAASQIRNVWVDQALPLEARDEMNNAVDHLRRAIALVEQQQQQQAVKYFGLDDVTLSGIPRAR